MVFSFSLSLFVYHIGVHIQLQEKLLQLDTKSQKPDKEFLLSLSVEVGSKWPSLAVSLLLGKGEIVELKEKVWLSQQELAFQMLRTWSSREEATYGQLYRKLNSITTPSHSFSIPLEGISVDLLVIRQASSYRFQEVKEVIPPVNTGSTDEEAVSTSQLSPKNQVLHSVALTSYTV